MANLCISNRESKVNLHLETISNPIDALEFFEALNLAITSIDVTWQNGPKIQEAILRLSQLQSFFLLNYAADMERRLSNTSQQKVA